MSQLLTKGGRFWLPRAGGEPLDGGRRWEVRLGGLSCKRLGWLHTKRRIRRWDIRDYVRFLWWWLQGVSVIIYLLTGQLRVGNGKTWGALWGLEACKWLNMVGKVATRELRRWIAVMLENVFGNTVKSFGFHVGSTNESTLLLLKFTVLDSLFKAPNSFFFYS